MVLVSTLSFAPNFRTQRHATQYNDACRTHNTHTKQHSQGCYRFDRYKSSAASPADAAKSGDSSSGNLKAIPSRPQLVCPPGAQRERVEALARAFAFARDAINTPANDMGPQHLAAEAAALAAAHEGASCVVVEGDALLAEGYPAVHTVGRASSRCVVCSALMCADVC